MHAVLSAKRERESQTAPRLLMIVLPPTPTGADAGPLCSRGHPGIVTGI